jgi:hypothetical protein
VQVPGWTFQDRVKTGQDQTLGTSYYDKKDNRSHNVFNDGLFHRFLLTVQIMKPHGAAAGNKKIIAMLFPDR